MFSALFFCAANILANGDFEAMVGKDVAAWSLPAKSATYRVADGVGRNGSRGLVWDDPKGDVYVTSRNRIDVKPGVSYSFAGWIKVDRISGQGAYAALYFDWYSQDGKWIDGCASSFASKVGEWVRVTGKTQNPSGTKPFSMSLSYFSFTPAVISVSIMPGHISLTSIPSPARRSANSLVIIPTPALEMQYSPRLIELVYAEQEEILTILPAFPCLIIRFATACVKNSVPLVFIPMT